MLLPRKKNTNQRNAWWADEYLQTPEGEQVRLFNSVELATSGSGHCDYLFPDGVLLQGWGTSACFSTNGRYFTSALSSQQHHWQIAVLDRQTKQVYYYPCEFNFWNIEQFTDTEIIGSCGMLLQQKTIVISLEKLLTSAKQVALVPIRDIWIEPNEQLPDENSLIEWPCPEGHSIQGRLALPDSLMALHDPLEVLQLPRYQLIHDGRETALQLFPDAPPIWRTDEKAMVCLSHTRDLTETDYWYWTETEGWRQLAPPRLPQNVTIPLYTGEAKFYEGKIWLELNMGAPAMDYPDYSYGTLSYGELGNELIANLDEYGSIQVSIAPLRSMWVEISETVDSNELSIIHSITLRPDGQILTGHLQPGPEGHDNDSYRYRVGDWTLPGSWQLEHCISASGHHLALLPLCTPESFPDHVVIADLERQRLIKSPPLLVEHLLDFHENHLSLVILAGSLSRDYKPHPLQRWDQPPPPPEQARHITEQQLNGKPCHKRITLQLNEDRAMLLPNYRKALRPQAANANGDFVLKAPYTHHFAWMKSSDPRFIGLRPTEPRENNFLITSLGHAISGLTPSFCWSTDGRYLAMTFMADWNNDHNDDPEHQVQWKLWLLDLAENTLRQLPGSIGVMPRFESFDNRTLFISTLEHTCRLSTQAKSRQIFLADILEYPAIPLIARENLWVLPEDKTPFEYWRHFIDEIRTDLQLTGTTEMDLRLFQ